jgi:hypothetical protein
MKKKIPNLVETQQKLSKKLTDCKVLSFKTMFIITPSSPFSCTYLQFASDYKLWFTSIEHTIFLPSAQEQCKKFSHQSSSFVQ